MTEEMVLVVMNMIIVHKNTIRFSVIVNGLSSCYPDSG